MAKTFLIGLIYHLQDTPPRLYLAPLARVQRKNLLCMLLTGDTAAIASTQSVSASSVNVVRFLGHTAGPNATP
jgi:hypothetical protein